MNVDLRQVLIDIRETLPEVPIGELKLLRKHWRSIEKLSLNSNADFIKFNRYLAESLGMSKTLIEHGFLTVISSPFLRFDPLEDASDVNHQEDNLPAVHNEVIEIANLLDELINNNAR